MWFSRLTLTGLFSRRLLVAGRFVTSTLTHTPPDKMDSTTFKCSKKRGRVHKTLNERSEDLQLDGFVPVDDVARQGKGLDVDHMDVASLRAYVQPLALVRQVDVSDPVIMETQSENYPFSRATAQRGPGPPHS